MTEGGGSGSPALRYDGVIFDLDGTLVDTLEDIAAAMNRVLALEGAPGHTSQEYRYLIGRGIRNLVTESLPAELRSEERVARCYERMLEDYGRNSLVKTRVYDGVPELVRELRAAGLPLAIHSNKADAPTQEIVAALLDPADFAAVRGARPDAPLKPDPAVALAIAARFGLPPERVAYLGDSLVDMRTAGAAGMIAVGAAWGFRTRRDSWRAARPSSSTRRSSSSGCAAESSTVGYVIAPASRSSAANAGMSDGACRRRRGPRRGRPAPAGPPRRPLAR